MGNGITTGGAWETERASQLRTEKNTAIAQQIGFDIQAILATGRKIGSKTVKAITGRAQAEQDIAFAGRLRREEEVTLAWLDYEMRNMGGI